VSVTIGTNFLTAKTARYTQFHDAAISETLAHQNEVAVYCCRHTVIPANTSITVNRKMGAQNGFLVNMLQPAETLPGGILIAASVEQSDNSHGESDSDLISTILG